jgi:hypothetical protein
MVKAFAERFDGFSIGSNDLTRKRDPRDTQGWRQVGLRGEALRIRRVPGAALGPFR